MRSVQSEILPTLEPTPVAIELALNLHRSLRVTLAVVRQGVAYTSTTYGSKATGRRRFLRGRSTDEGCGREGEGREAETGLD